MVVDQANLNAKQEPFSGVNNWLAADCLFSRATQGVRIKLMDMCVCVLCVFVCVGGGALQFQDNGLSTQWEELEALKWLFISIPVIAGEDREPQKHTTEQSARSYAA